MMFMMLSGEIPFYADNVNAVFKKIESCSFSMKGENWNNVSEESKHLVSRLLCLNTHDRLSAQEALMHPVIHKTSVLSIGSHDLLDKLTSYSEFSFLKKCIYTVLVKYIDFDKLLEERKYFLVYDKNLTGVITAIEVCDTFEEIGIKFTQQTVSALMAKNGIRNKGNLRFSEFASMLITNGEHITEEIMKLTFEFFDKDRKGYFNVKNYMDAVDLLGGKIDSIESEQQLKEISVDGMVSFTEFKTIFKN